MLRAYDRYGHRIDEVEFHPAWHELMALATSHEVGTIVWRPGVDHGLTVRAALSIVFYQAEAGIMCPMSLSNAAPAVLRLVPDLAETWEPLALSGEHDPRSIPVDGKRGAMIACRWCTRRSSATAATATWRTRRSRGSSGRRR